MNEQWLTDRLAEIAALEASGEITDKAARADRWRVRCEAGTALDDKQFKALVATFVANVQETQQAQTKAMFPNATPPTFEIMTGRRYVRVVQHVNSGSRHAYCFIDRQTGFILKCDGWKSPAKGPRGTILDPDAHKIMTMSGAPYAR